MSVYYTCLSNLIRQHQENGFRSTNRGLFATVSLSDKTSLLLKNFQYPTLINYSKVYIAAVGATASSESPRALLR